MFSNVRPNLKTIAIVDSESDNLVCSSGFTVLRCLESEPEYLITALLDDSFTNSIVKKETGSNYPAVTSKDVLNANVPSAPIEVQKEFSAFVKQVDKSEIIFYAVIRADFDGLKLIWLIFIFYYHILYNIG